MAGYLRSGQAHHLTQQQHGALQWRQVLERDDEGQFYAFALFVARLGRGADIEQPPVWVGLQP